MLKSKYNGVAPGQDGARERAELREVARMHMAALVDLLQSSEAIEPHTMIFVPPGDEDNARGYIALPYSDSEELQFYVSPGREAGEYIADRIYFGYNDPDAGTGVLLEVTKEMWAQDLYEQAISVHVAEAINKGQRAN